MFAACPGATCYRWLADRAWRFACLKTFPELSPFQTPALPVFFPLKGEAKLTTHVTPYPYTGSIIKLRCCRFGCPQVFFWLLIRHHTPMERIFACSVKPAWIFEQLRNQSSLKKNQNPFWSCILPHWVKMKFVTAELQSITLGHFSFKWEMSRSLCNTAGRDGGMLPAALPAWWSNKWLMSSTQHCEK